MPISKDEKASPQFNGAKLVAVTFCLLLSFILPATAQESAEATSSLTHFSRLNDQATGIDFVSPLIPDHPYAYLYHSGMTCSGIAAGDLNGDDRPDLFLANGPGKNKLYLQTGSGIQFVDVTQDAGVGLDGGEQWAAGVALADVDNDGDLDLYVCNYQSANQLFINLGPGDGKPIRFKEVAEQASVAIKDASHMPAFCDYDNDGDLDFYLLTNRIENPDGELAKLPVEFKRPGVPSLLPGFEQYYDLWIVDADNWGVEPSGRSDYLFRNDGTDADGQVRFTDVTTSAGISGRGDGLSCTWFDADRDGDSDLYVGNDFISTDRFYLNNGDGTFSNQIAEAMAHTTWFSMGSDFGDLDNDGDFDLFVADMSATSHYKSKVTMGIMGGIVMKRANASNPPQYMRNTLFLNTGHDADNQLRFREGAYLAGIASSDWTWSVKMKDFDADGNLDIFLTNGVPREMNHSDIAITRDMLVGKHMWDFFKEGDLRKEQNRAFRNNGNLKFDDVSKDWGLDHLGASYGAVCADFDRDGDLDIAVMNLEENVSIYRNDGKTGSQLTVKLRGTTANRMGVGAVVTVESGEQKWIRQLMPGTGYHSYDEPILHFGLGDKESIDRLIVQWPGGDQQIVTDVKVNDQITITQKANTEVASTTKPTAAWFKPSGELEDLWHQESLFDDFALQPLLPHRLSAEGPCMAWGDVNGDGRDDVFVGGSAGTSGELRLAIGDGMFEMSDSQVFMDDADAEDGAAVFGDFNQDGHLDLIVGSGSYEMAEDNPLQRDRLYLNDGKGKFRKAIGALPKTTTNTGTLATADFDGDGDLDLFVGTRVQHGKYPLSSPSAIWLNDKGKFTDATKMIAEGLTDAGMVTGAAWADVNQDGSLDLVVSREWDNVLVFANEKGKLVQRNAGELTSRTGWWSDLSTGDIDGDGDVDLLVTNVGLNTKYKTGLKKPMTVYYGEFDESGKAHIVEVKQEGEACFPERGRSCSSNAMPFIADKFETFHEFGLATLEDIYGEEKLGQARRFEANTFEHGVFINDGSGKFKFKALPRIAQIAPSHAATLADLDGDKDLDIVMGQNFFGPQSETGRYDGGLGQILKNDGKGSFEPVSPNSSGMFVRLPATAISVRDLNADGKPDIVVATNDGPVQIFINND